ncbi:pyochelin biosynthetic protein PchC [Catenulispora sp. GAS73]|uniref:thioesterase II family protein n=1 Tax=Catenulispora sp. GAS73 TaxID=3156269 RepID=UPI003513C229
MSRIREQGWIRTLTAVRAPSVRLVCFPHSGGSAFAFRDWAAALPPGVELLAVQYPGRGDRFGEDLVDDVAELAGHAVGELLRRPAAEQVLFGHSLGAMVAYETAVLLRDVGCEPVRLCPSACLPPGQMANRDVHRAPDREFWDSLLALGGIDPRIAEDMELRQMLTPALRSDLRAHATYRPGSTAASLSCPISCYHGAGDPLVDQSRLPRWGGVTSGEFRLRVRPGGHFHVTADVAELVSDILAPR